MELLKERDDVSGDRLGESIGHTFLSPDWAGRAAPDDPAMPGVRPPGPGPRYWNALTRTNQTEEELWAWSGDWDM
jgi:hypothetical protein